ncbi:hypothetical protein D9M69_645170 [compost metagenome]
MAMPPRSNMPNVRYSRASWNTRMCSPMAGMRQSCPIKRCPSQRPPPMNKPTTTATIKPSSTGQYCSTACPHCSMRRDMKGSSSPMSS